MADFLGAVEFEQTEPANFKKTALVVAFAPVAKKVVDTPAKFLRSEKSHIEPSPDQTEITLATTETWWVGEIRNQRPITKPEKIVVPFGYDDVKQLLEKSAATGKPVDFTPQNRENLRAGLKRP